MPRPGGESNKLGNQYESLWTATCLIAVADGLQESICVEPRRDDAVGIEFVLRDNNGTEEFHCVKRQKTRGEWTLSELAKPRGGSTSNRSILDDMLNTLKATRDSRYVFVSSTSASTFQELIERANRCSSSEQLQKDIENSTELLDDFKKHILSRTKEDWNLAHNFLRRIRVSVIDESQLRSNVEQHIAFLVYRIDGTPFVRETVRPLLEDFLGQNIGTEIRQNNIWNYLKEAGYGKKNWALDEHVQQCVAKRVDLYLRSTESKLINDIPLQRNQTNEILEEVQQETGKKVIILSGDAGSGKSCVLAQAVNELKGKVRPIFVFRITDCENANSADAFGKGLGLPVSPTIVLAGIANGGDCVLVIDQLDEISETSGRYPRLWDVFDSIRQEAADYPNMTLVVACRTFDLNNDHRLRKLKDDKTTRQINIEPLADGELDSALERAGVNAGALNAAQKELLRTPLHLYLFLNSSTDGRRSIALNNFPTVGDLFHAYWAYKEKQVRERCGGNGNWNELLDTICEVMTKRLALHVPEDKCDNWPATKDAMLAENVLVRDEGQIRFFHESFFDYAFARWFSRMDQRLVRFLLASEQHLFRLGQVRQVLWYLRNSDRKLYLSQLKELLAEPKVRFHIKRLVFGWLGSLPDPDREEWAIIEPMLADYELWNHILVPLRNGLAWFDLLDGLGVISGWLANDDDRRIRLGMWFLDYSEVQKHRSERAATLISPYLGRSPEWTDRIRTYFWFGNTYQSRPIQELFLASLRGGAFDKPTQEQHNSWSDMLQTASKEAPSFALEALAAWMDRHTVVELGASDDASTDWDENSHSAILLIKEVATREPAAYVEKILPRVLAIVKRSIETTADSRWYDLRRGLLTNHEPLSISGAILASLVTTLEWLAKDSLVILEARVTDIAAVRCHTTAVLLLKTWSANPRHFGDDCIRFMATRTDLLEIGYAGVFGGGNGAAAISRAAIERCIPYATPDARTRLEESILAYSDRVGTFADKCSRARLLLESFGLDRLSEQGKQWLLTLREQFPRQDTSVPATHSKLGRFAGSPVPTEELAEYTDKQLLAAMKKHDYGWDDRSGRTDRISNGTAVELSRELQPLARKNRRRFAALIAQMDDAIRTEYFDEIVNGIFGVKNLTEQERSLDDEDFRQFETEVALNVVRRLHRLPKHPCGKSICEALERLADRELSEEDLEILRYYAVEDRDPDVNEDTRHRSESHPDRMDLFNKGYNSVRGRAASAIRELLDSSPNRKDVLLLIIEKVTRDPSVAVRCCVIESLLPLLTHDGEKAVRLFSAVCANEPILFGTEPFEIFIHQAGRSHYAALRELLQDALRSNSEAAVTAAARQICLAAFSDTGAEDDAQKVREGTVEMRRAAAEVYARNLGNPSLYWVCQEHLVCYFADEDVQVREMAATCFRHLPDDVNARKLANLIEAYIGSPAFPTSGDDLLRRLDGSTWQLPDVIIRLARKFVDACGAQAGDASKRDAYDAKFVSTLVMRLYVQTDDEAIKTECLDLFDEMLRLRFYGVEDEFKLHDR